MTWVGNAKTERVSAQEKGSGNKDKGDFFIAEKN